MTNIIQDNVTYQDLIKTAAHSLHELIKNDSLPKGTYKKSSVTVTMGVGVTIGKDPVKVDAYKPDEYPQEELGFKSQEKTFDLIEEEVRAEDYIPPTEEEIIEDINDFIKRLDMPTDGVPTSEGLVTFFFALNFFVEKAIIKKTVSAEEGEPVKMHLHYKIPEYREYSKINFRGKAQNTVTQDRIGAIYNQVKATSMLSDGARQTVLKSSAHTSSSSSSSCSSSCSSSSCSSSCSSSSSSSSSLFIAYFNLA